MSKWCPIASHLFGESWCHS